MREPVVFTVNGTECRLDVDPERSLLEVLRDDLDLVGCKYGCGEGQCGACTVLVDGRATRSCTMAAGAVAGRAVRTIEGLATGDRLHPVQEAFLRAGAMQCGYCTPGMILSAVALLEGAAQPPSEDEITAALQGNLCRCGVYPRIVAAVSAVAKSMAEVGR
ncbi:MAG TPA: (2Fe-2S)-binding protein [Planctomycetota bacterium]|nr:(2Fe-2S)-binding protein [Planctomycetota bacterium]